MKRFCLLALLGCSAIAHAEGILSRHGAGGSLLQRNGGQAEQVDIVIDGQRYTVPVGATIQVDGAARRSIPDSYTGRYISPTRPTVVDPHTGTVRHDVGPGYINPHTGQFTPK